MTLTRQSVLFGGLALVASALVVWLPNAVPRFTDAYYHYNAAVRVARGDGFVDDYLWMYVGAPDSLPAPSHLYWMPGTSIVGVLGMVVGGISYRAAQLGLIACLWAACVLAYCVGYSFQQKRRHAWVAVILLLAGGFMGRFWGSMDTFAPYAAAGGWALWLMGMGVSRRGALLWVWLGAGIASGAGHLVRTDGLLLLALGWFLVLVMPRTTWAERVRFIGVFTLGYLLVMTPWFLRNLAEVGSALPVGGTQAIWYTKFDDLFNYPADASPATFFAAGGVGLLLSSRWEGLSAALQTLIAVEGLVVLAPFMLSALWQRRRDTFWWPVILFALGMHLALALLFPFPAARGSIFHACAALMPFWMALGVVGMDEAIVWVSRRRRHWRPQTAQPVFTVALVVYTVAMSLAIMLPRISSEAEKPIYGYLRQIIPPGSRVMRNDPSQLYYYTGLGGVALPNEPMETAQLLIETYEVDFVLLEYPDVPIPLYEAPVPAEWVRVPLPLDNVELYDVRR
jgi:hypothetical protein